MNNNLMKKLWSTKALTGALVFLLPFLSLLTRSGVSAISFLFVLLALVCWRDCRDALVAHWRAGISAAPA